VFVPLAAAGDRLLVRVREMKGKAAFAEIEEVIAPSERRIEPPCPYFGTCGGCDFQQMDYAAQVDAKVGIIRDCLHRIGKIDYTGEFEVIASPLEFGYRTRAQWHADVNKQEIGYYRRLSHDVVDVDHCPIASPELNETLKELRGTIEWGTIWGNRIAIDVANGDEGDVSIYSSELTVPTSEITTSVAGERFNYTARNFFQGNRSVVEQLVAAVEENPAAVDFAERNARRAGLANISHVRGKVDRFVKEEPAGTTDFLLLDPPRAGGSKETVLNITRLAAPHISYVSCEPSTLARDLRWMLDAGYRIDRITAVDMFPQTHHVETVVRLTRVD
jgi:23S rRNA (uracil1939-C5)-methyltransferase